MKVKTKVRKNMQRSCLHLLQSATKLRLGVKSSKALIDHIIKTL